MARFRYRLQAALERSIECERSAQRAYAAAALTVASERGAIAVIEAAAEAVRARRGTVSAGALAFADQDRHLLALHVARDRCAVRGATGARTLESKRAELVAATSGRAALERHRVRKLEASMRAEDLREANELDECNARATERRRA